MERELFDSSLRLRILLSPLPPPTVGTILSSIHPLTLETNATSLKQVIIMSTEVAKNRLPTLLAFTTFNFELCYIRLHISTKIQRAEIICWSSV